MLCAIGIVSNRQTREGRAVEIYDMYICIIYQMVILTPNYPSRQAAVTLLSGKSVVSTISNIIATSH